MATKQEDISTLNTLRDALKKQEELHKSIQTEQNKIEKEKKRSVPDYPSYMPTKFEYKPKRVSGVVWDANNVVSVYYWIAIYLTAFCFLVWALSDTEDSAGTVFVVTCILTALGIVGKAGHLIAEHVMEKTLDDPREDVIAPFVRGGVMLICAIVCVVADSEIASAFAFVCTGLSVLLGVGQYVAYCVYRKHKENVGELEKEVLQEENEARAAYEKEEEVRRAEYDAKKAEAEIEIICKRRDLEAEVASNIASCEERIAEYKRGMVEQQRTLDASPILSQEDKNVYTVTVLLNYLSAGKANSYEEAIKLFNEEERPKTVVAAAQRIAAERLAVIQDMLGEK